MTENKNQSFAERFAKKPAYTKQNILEESNKNTIQEKAQQKKDITAIANVDPQKKSKADLIYLVKGVDAGRNAWYYVLVERLKLQLFLKALNDDIIHLENYGVILYSAYGDEPPAEITNKLKAEYGIK